LTISTQLFAIQYTEECFCACIAFRELNISYGFPNSTFFSPYMLMSLYIYEWFSMGGEVMNVNEDSALLCSSKGTCQNICLYEPEQSLSLSQDEGER